MENADAIVELLGWIAKMVARRLFLSRSRLLSSIIVVIVAASSIIGIRYLWKAEVRKKREVTYQAALRSYSSDLKPGLARKEVENYLRTRHVSFSQMCCLGPEFKYWVDRVKIGEEAAPWYCEQAYVYLAFEFAATEPHDHFSGSYFARDSDMLKKIEIYQPYEGCL